MKMPLIYRIINEILDFLFALVGAAFTIVCWYFEYINTGYSFSIIVCPAICFGIRSLLVKE